MQTKVSSAMPIADIFSAAMQDHRTGRIADAIGGYRRVLAEQPHHVDALHLLGGALLQDGQADAAVAMIEQAIARSGAGGAGAGPQHAPLYVNLGSALHASGQLERAIDGYRRGLTLAPHPPEPPVRLGDALPA